MSSLLIQESVRPENVSHPLVMTLKFVPPHGGWVEAPTADLIDAIAKRLVEPLDALGLRYKLNEIIVHGNESRVLFG